jgi:hypothetical protein
MCGVVKPLRERHRARIPAYAARKDPPPSCLTLLADYPHTHSTLRTTKPPKHREIPSTTICPSGR